jgi:hypothetical protein
MILKFEDFVNESLSFKNNTFVVSGIQYTVKKITGNEVETTNKKFFDLKTLIKNGVQFTAPYKAPKAIRVPKAKPRKTKVMTTRQYEKMLKGLVEDMGDDFDPSFTYDLAGNLFIDQEVYNYLKKEHPRESDQKLKQILQWDLEGQI